MAVATKAPGFSAAIRKWAYNLSGFNKYGLHHDDCLYENDDVKEALRRLPERVVDERNFRINRALHLSMSKITLPKAEWTQFEQDNRYLKSYLEEVVKERMEREEWNKA